MNLLSQRTEPAIALWFGRADRPWSQGALRALLTVAQVTQVSGPDLAHSRWKRLPAAADLLVVEEHRPGEISSQRLQHLLRRYPLAGLVVLQGPWSGASHAPQWLRPFPVLEVPWHSWFWFLDQLQRADPAAEGEQVPLVPIAGACRRGQAPQSPFPPLEVVVRPEPSDQECWLLISDAELGRFLAEELTAQGEKVRRLAVPAVPAAPIAGASGVPGTLYWQLGAWFPDRPQRELDLLARLFRPRRIVALGVHAWPELDNQAVCLFPAEVVFLPLPLPEGSLTTCRRRLRRAA